MVSIEAGDVKILDTDLAILGCYNQEDGSGYIHCFLETFHPTYARMRNGNYRIYLAKSIRLGAAPEIIKTNFDPSDLHRFPTKPKYFSAENPYAVYDNISRYGVSLRPELLKMYAKYLGTSYRLFDSNLDMIEEYFSEETKCPYTNIIKLSDHEYHLLVKPQKMKRGDDENVFRYTVLNVDMS